jgi:translation elongation factor EF-1beta
MSLFRETLREILLLRKYSKQQAQSGIDVLKLNKGEEKKEKRKKKVETEQQDEGAVGFGLKESGKKVVVEEEEEA